MGKVDRKPFIVALIPAYNEEKTIAKVVLKALRHVDKVIVCDDGSTDMTADIAEALGAEVIRHPRNMGYGATITSLLRRANELSADVAVTLDADGQHNPEDIPRLVDPILRGDADLVIGSRFIESNGQGIPGYRRAGIKAITALYNLASKLGVSDAQSGYRAYSLKALRTVVPNLTETGMGVSLQILRLVDKAKLKVAEIPVNVRYDVEKSSTRNPLLHGAELVWTLARLVALEKPLKYLGVPSLLILGAGIASAVHLILVFNQTRYFSIPLAIVTLGLLLFGLVLATSTLTFHALSLIFKRIEGRNENSSSAGN